MKWKLNGNVTLKKIGIDFIPVFLGVLVAMMFGNIQENFREKRFVESSLGHIYENNLTNITNIEQNLERNKPLLDSLNKYRDSTELSVLDLLQMNDGYAINTKELTGWYMLKNSKQMSRVDYEIISLMTIIEISIDRYETFFLNRVTQLMDDNMYSTDPKVKRQLAGALSDYLNTTKELLKNIKKVNTKLKQELDI